MKEIARQSWHGESIVQRVSSLRVTLTIYLSYPAVFRKLVATALRYTPVILEHHIPYKTLPNGKL